MKEIIALALPVALSNLGIMAMQLVDVWVVGRLNAAAIGAVGLASSIFVFVMIVGQGLMSSLDFYVARAVGRKNTDEAYRYTWQAVWLVISFGIPATFFLLGMSKLIPWFGVHPDVVPGAQSFLAILSLSLIPVLFAISFRSYLQAFGIARPSVVIYVVGNILNLLLDFGLVFGRFGFPRLEVAGAAWATCLVRLFMMFAFALVALKTDLSKTEDRRTLGQWLRTEGESNFRPNLTLMRELLSLGLPAAGQMALEVGAFTMATALAARFAPELLAAHEIVLTLASVTFMVPLGISMAGSVLVGQAVGAEDFVLARQRGWQVLRLGIGYMAFSCVCLLLFPHALLGFFTRDVAVVDAALGILFFAAAFQLFDGAQVTATGVLRGLGDSRSSFFANLIGHWAIGIPLAIYLSQWLGFGLKGVWLGLSLGLVFVALSLTFKWRRSSEEAILNRRA